MARTFINPTTQVNNSDVYDDTLASGAATLVTGSTSLTSDLNGLRSQVKRIMGSSNWFDNPTSSIATLSTNYSSLSGTLTSVSSSLASEITNRTNADSALSGRVTTLETWRGTTDTDVSALKTWRTSTVDPKLTSLQGEIDALENKTILYRTIVLTNISATSGSQYVTVPLAALPSPAAAVGAVTTEGVVVASIAAIGASLNRVAGDNPTSPKNLVILRDSVTGQAIQSTNGHDIMGLLQTTAANGANFTSSNLQITFVRENSTGDDLEICNMPSALQFDYSYVHRRMFSALPEQAFLAGAWVDNVGSVDVTLSNAINNQNGNVVQNRLIEWRLDTAGDIQFRTNGATPERIMQVHGATATVYAGNVSVDNLISGNKIDMSGVISTNSDIQAAKGTGNEVSLTTGYIKAAGVGGLTVFGEYDVKVVGEGGEVTFHDSYGLSSGEAPLKLSETDQEWTEFYGFFPTPTLLAALNTTYSIALNTSNSQSRTIATYIAAAPVAAGSNIVMGTSVSFPDAAAFNARSNVYLNGTRVMTGLGNDCELVSGANCTIKFPQFALQTDDVVVVERFGF